MVELIRFLMRPIALGLLFGLFFPTYAQAEWGNMDDPLSRSGFVAIEGGVWQITSGSNLVTNPIMLYLTAGFNLADELGLKDTHESWNYVPKIGFGMGETVTPNRFKYFYDAMLKFRYTFGRYGQPVRVFLDAGPGVISYHNTSFEVEAGAGVNVYLGQSLLGLNVQYKELFHSEDLHRGVVILGTLGWHYGE